MAYFNTHNSNEKTAQKEEKRAHPHHLYKIINESTVKTCGSPQVYLLKTKTEDLNPKGMIRRCTFGKNDPRIRNRTIMMVGATGSGKSTHINSIVNYILGVKQEDDFRIEIINESIKSKSQAESQTTAVTVYKINKQDNFRVLFSLTIIDTPGFGDTRGIEQDRIITESLRELFKSPRGVHIIDAVCFVVQASQARLTPTQRYIFDSILSIFGKDIEKNIMITVTFADGKPPAVLEAINAAGIPCIKDKKGKPVHFKFNNSALYSVCNSKKQSGKDSDDDDESFDEMFWKLGEKSMKRFFEAVNEMEPKSLQLTQEVLKERKQLQACVEGLQPQINAALNKQEELRQTRQEFEKNKDKMEENKNFTYTVPVSVKEKKDTDHYSNNCNHCKMTCHDDCSWAIVLKWCDVMEDSKCTVCPGKCSVDLHVREKANYIQTVKHEKRTYQEQKAQYEQACGATMNAEMVLAELQRDLDETEKKAEMLLQKSHECVSRLEEIALKPNPLSATDYIELLISKEIEEHKPGFKERIGNLQKKKEQAQIIQSVVTEISPSQLKTSLP